MLPSTIVQGMLILQATAAVAYGWQGDIARAAYWVGAFLLTSATLHMR